MKNIGEYYYDYDEDESGSGEKADGGNSNSNKYQRVSSGSNNKQYPRRRPPHKHRCSNKN